VIITTPSITGLGNLFKLPASINALLMKYKILKYQINLNLTVEIHIQSSRGENFVQTLSRNGVTGLFRFCTWHDCL